MSADQPEACGLRTLERTVGLYLGIPIQYYATIDLEGFTHLIDEVGPLRLRLDGRLVDPTYNGPGRHLEGEAAGGRAARWLQVLRWDEGAGLCTSARG